MKKVGTHAVAKVAKKPAVKKAKDANESKGRGGPAARRKECPDCGSPNVLYESTNEQLICHDCGLIFEELPPDLEKEYDRASEA